MYVARKVGDDGNGCMIHVLYTCTYPYIYKSGKRKEKAKIEKKVYYGTFYIQISDLLSFLLGGKITPPMHSWATHTYISI